MIQKLLAACVIAAGWSVAAYELAPEKLQWELTPHCKVIERDGRRILTVQVPEEAKDIRGRNCAFAKIDLTPFQEGIFECSVLFRGKAVKAAAEWFPGVSFSFYFKDETTGQEEWPGIARVLGTFGWKSGAFSENIPKGAKTGILRLGIENASGEAEFDLSTLKISTPDPLLKEKGETLSAADAAEFDRMKRRITDSLLSKRAENEERIQADLALLRPDGSFSDVDYRDTNRSAWKTSRHLNYTIELARAWAKPGHPRYHDREVGEAVRKAVGCWSRNKFQNSNWWWNDMFVPQKMGEILLMADPLFPEGPEREAALDVCRQAMLLHRYTGNNRVFIAANIFYRALLERNERALSVAAGALSEEIRMAPVENKSDWSFGGIRADGCYHQHGPQIQFGNYGCEFFNNIAYWANIWQGTRWELDAAQWEVMRLLAFDGFRWVLWRGEMDLLAGGRQLGRGFASSRGRSVLNALEGLKKADPGDKAPYDEVLQSNRNGENALVGTRHFWNSDYTVHRRPGWYASVRMNSTRVCPIEDNVNWDNALGRYLSDGVCLVMRTGGEYREITPCWDWTRLPGSTLPKTPVYTQKESIAVNLKSGGRYPRWTHSRMWRHLGTTDFTGAVTDGRCAAAVYTMNIDGVKAKKAYFFDSDSIRQLVCGIDSTSPFEVATTVNSCLRNGEIRQGPGWFWHDGIGYRGSGMKLATGMREGDWRYLEGGLSDPMPVSKELFTLSIEHGLAPRGASCEYTILPGATPEATAAWRGGKTLANTPQLQAVELRDGRTGAVFHAPGRLGAFQTDSPGVFLIGKKEVWAADPAARLNRMKLTLGGVAREVPLPGGELAGRSVRVEF